MTKRIKNAENAGYRSDEIRSAAKIVLAQIDELMSRKQLDLFG